MYEHTYIPNFHSDKKRFCRVVRLFIQAHIKTSMWACHRGESSAGGQHHSEPEKTGRAHFRPRHVVPTYVEVL
jgi:hypothetical protein